MKEIKVKCTNCNGTGYLPQYDYNCNGVCFKCMGKGYVMEKQYTEKELKVKEDKINKKQYVNLKELRGFKNTDILYIVEGNTYDIKKQLKEDGAKWNMWFRAWVFENDSLKNKYTLRAVSFESTLNNK